jgi:anti-sigma factor RsiW
MMPRLTDERLIAYLDGELDGAERDAVARALDEDGILRDRAARLSESAALLRAAFDEVLHEPLPERLLAAVHSRDNAHKDEAPAAPIVVDLADARARHATRLDWQRVLRTDRRWQAALAASLFALLLGSGGGYLVATRHGPIMVEAPQVGAQPQAYNWLDNIAANHELLVNAGTGSTPAADNIRPPNLKPWGLDFRSARTLIVEGRPATQLFYTTDNKQLGPLTIVVQTTKLADLAPAWEHRDNVNLFYWRHNGHAYTLVGTADFGYLWNIHKDIAWQLDAI